MLLTFATRPSRLARAQTAHIIRLLQAARPALECQEYVITTKGDRIVHEPLPEIGDQGLFTNELEAALLSGQVDVAVHSLKDLPVEAAPGITIAAVPARDSAFDVLVSAKGQTLADLPEAARVGTCSLRRAAQLLACRPDLAIVPLRGNVDTRVRKLMGGEYDAIVLASAGLTRLGMQSHVTETLPLDVMLPAPGQGALAIQCRADDAETLDLLAALHDPLTYASVTAERAFLAGLGGGCSLPIGAFAQKTDGQIILTGGVISADGKRAIRLSAVGKEPNELGERLARFVLERGGADLLN
ncbi:MAG TPA: hydroxymethylbilane synthase [Anaerolineales bacterium]|nr:hydroxymethylbilane synthase [Anaerolineales bacterium]